MKASKHLITVLAVVALPLFSGAAFGEEQTSPLPDSVVFGVIATTFDEDWMGEEAIHTLRRYGMSFVNDEKAQAFADIVVEITPRLINEMRSEVVGIGCKTNSNVDIKTTLQEMDRVAFDVYDKYYQEGLAAFNQSQSEQLADLLWHARRDMIYRSFSYSLTQTGNAETNLKSFCNTFGGVGR